ncbi:MAG: hypothetical protein KGJ59_13950 [Bacteroidota bacterium]|nr:hypothetical protein [Bacteroidota bacterium]
MVRNSIIPPFHYSAIPLFLSAVVSLWLAGCDFPTKTISETTPPPFLASITISPDSLKIISSPHNPTATTDTAIQLAASVKDTNGAEDVRSVNFSLISADGSTILAAGELSGAGNGTYSLSVPLRVTTESAGTYFAHIQAENFSGLFSSTLSKAFIIVNLANHAPQLSNLVMPDTVFVPASGSTNVRVSVGASDSDGLSDIKSVTLTSLRPDSSVVGTFSLFDDGGVSPQPPFNISSGDAVAGDGVYTLTIPLSSTTEHPTYRVFVFKAVDRAGSVSNIISKTIYIE